MFKVTVGNEEKIREIVAGNAKEAAEKAVRKWRKERSFFATDCQYPSVTVDGKEFTPVKYATVQREVYDA